VIKYKDIPCREVHDLQAYYAMKSIIQIMKSIVDNFGRISRQERSNQTHTKASLGQIQGDRKYKG